MGNADVRHRSRRRHGAGHVRVPWARSVSLCAYLPERHDRLTQIQEGTPAVIGMVLAPGTGRRLRPDTDGLPKAMLPVAGETTILDIALPNPPPPGLTGAGTAVGYAAALVAHRVPALAR